MDDVCYCGHVHDEHLDTTMEPCDVDGCECVAFDPDPEAR